jgi:hypothetical protein
VTYQWEAVTQQTAGAGATYSSGDAQPLVNGIAVPAGSILTAQAYIYCLQGSTTAVWADRYGFLDTVSQAAAMACSIANWTGSLTITYRHSGVTAGGTGKWSWGLYKLAGQ